MSANKVEINHVDVRPVSKTKLRRMQRAAKAQAEAATTEERWVVLVDVKKLSESARAEVLVEVERHRTEQFDEFQKRVKMKPWVRPVQDVVVTYRDPNTGEMVDSPPVKNFVLGR